jgi:hypothetical protein
MMRRAPNSPSIRYCWRRVVKESMPERHPEGDPGPVYRRQAARLSVDRGVFVRAKGRTSCGLRRLTGRGSPDTNRDATPEEARSEDGLLNHGMITAQCPRKADLAAARSGEPTSDGGKVPFDSARAVTMSNASPRCFRRLAKIHQS